VCIDQWFTRSVFCPSCRHDIRIASPRLQASESPAIPPIAPLPNPVAPSSSSVSTESSSPSSDETLFQALGHR
jgi:hypothetical protein